MSSIHVLDESTINKIAAGEVVERPSAVVKELIENAMDAGATAITLEIKDGGLSLIRITDNGAGIEKEDIPVAFLRHATSKIRKAEDLLTVTSLGFRGEALSSIAAVAQVELITKTPSALSGHRYIIEGGQEKSYDEIGCPGGTTILVRNLFYNTPARRNFLKSATTEAGYISDLMERLLVSHPDVSFKYINNNQVKLQSTGNNNRKDILYQVYGRDITKELLSVDYQSKDVKITGFIGKPVINRGNRNFENYFINGRYIKSSIIMKSIEEAYKPFLMQHKYPFTSLYYDITPSLIDVNVHPQKLEIRLQNSEEIHLATLTCIRNALSGKEMIPKVQLTEQKNDTKNIAKNQVSLPEPFEVNRRNQIFVKESNPYGEKTEELSYDKNKLISNNMDKEDPLGLDKIIPSHTINGGKINSDLNDFKSNHNAPLSYNPYAKKHSIPVINSLKNDPQHETNTKIVNNNSNGNLKQDIIENSKENLKTLDINTISNSNNLDINTINDSNNLDINTINNSKNSNINTINDLNTNILIDTSNLIRNNKTELDLQKDYFPNQIDKDKSSDTPEQLTLFTPDTEKDEAPFLSQKAMEQHRIIGQLFSTYWLIEYKKELFIIDQHAAHEKILYERMMVANKEKNYQSQQLLPPIVLTLTLKEQEILTRYQETLECIGYEIEPFGGNEYSVRAVPADLYGISEKSLLMEFIDHLAEDNTNLTTDSILEKVASLSCKAAVKANHSFSNQEAAALIKELLNLDNPYHCPHGRPVMISMSQYELERKFKRIL